LRETYLSIPEGLPGDSYHYRAWVLENNWALPAERVRAFNPFALVPQELSGKILGGECCAWTEVMHDCAELEYKVLNRLVAFGAAMR
jgi:N-acetyl-beta-hexosaminidase